MCSYLATNGFFKIATRFWAQRKIPVVLYPVHQNPRFHGQKLILILSVHKNRCFHGQERQKTGIANDEQMVLWTFVVSGSPWVEPPAALDL